MSTAPCTSQALIVYTPSVQHECPICYLTVIHDTYWRPQACGRHGTCLQCYNTCAAYGLRRCPICRALNPCPILTWSASLDHSSSHIHSTVRPVSSTDTPLYIYNDPLYSSIPPRPPPEPTTTIDIYAYDVIFSFADNHDIYLRRE
jgi:hypothetical protein